MYASLESYELRHFSTFPMSNCATQDPNQQEHLSRKFTAISDIYSMKNEKFTVGFKYCDWNQDPVTLVGLLAILVPMHTILDCIACVVSTFVYVSWFR